MNVSMDGALGFLEVKTTPLTSADRQGTDQLSFRSIAEQEEETRKQERSEQQVGLPFPGQETPEERHRIEQLKSKAMQIAAQSENGLTPEQEAEIKAIEKEIGKISREPMSEDLSGKAKKMAEQVRLEQNEILEEQSEFQTRIEEFDAFGVELPKGDGGPGMAMLRQNALVTSIKSVGAGGGLG